MYINGPSDLVPYGGYIYKAVTFNKFTTQVYMAVTGIPCPRL